MAVLAVVLAIIVIGAMSYALWRSTTPENWKDRGEPRGRTKAEPEGTLHIKVTRADGTVEDHGTVPAHRSN